MGKLLKRISASDLTVQSKNLLGKEVNVVLNSDAVFFGKLKEASDKILTIIDLRGKKHRFELEKISVVIYDMEK